MKQTLHGVALLGALALAVPDARADTITLLNGITLTGRVASISAEALEFGAGDKSRLYPWSAMAPGTRFRYDQTYRMNLPGFLSGAEKSTLTNPPDPQYVPRPAGTDTAAEPDPEAAPPSTSFDLYAMAPAEPVVIAKLGLGSNQPVNSFVWCSFQFGFGADDIAFYGLPREGDGKLAHFTKGASRISFKDPPASPDATGYAADVFTQTTGDVISKVKIEWLTGEERALRADVEIARGDLVRSFTLTGKPSTLSSPETAMFAQALIAPPQFDFAPRVEQDRVIVLGRIRMGPFTLRSGRGMNNKLTITLRDGRGNTLLEQELDHTADGTYPLKCEAGALQPGQRYTLKASADLGEWLGRLDQQQEFLLPEHALR